MTPAQAEHLAVRLSQRWRNMGPVDELTADLEDLEEGAANTAYVRLRRTAERPVSIAEFRSTALSLTMTDAGNRPTPCIRCDDMGWVEAPDLRIDDQAGNTRTYTQVRPCTCREGAHRASSRTWTGRTR